MSRLESVGLSYSSSPSPILLRKQKGKATCWEFEDFQMFLGKFSLAKIMKVGGPRSSSPTLMDNKTNGFINGWVACHTSYWNAFFFLEFKVEAKSIEPFPQMRHPQLSRSELGGVEPPQ